MLRRLHHVGVAVADLAAPIRFYTETLGMCVIFQERAAPYNVYAVGLTPPEGGALLELVAPAGSPNVLESFLAARGDGIHHLAYEVDDIRAAIVACKALGLRMLDETPRAAFQRAQVAFIHPKSTGGILTELVQLGGTA